MQLLSELQWLDRGRNSTVCNLVLLCSEPLSEPNKPGAAHRPGNLSLQNHCTPAREPSLSSDVPLYLKQSRGGLSVGCRKKKKEKPRPRYHHLILIFFPIPFFNPSDEVWTGRGMLSQTAISLHHMRLTHRMAGRRGVCREHSQETGEGKKIHNMKSRTGLQSGHTYTPVMFCLQHPLVLL